MFRSYSLRSTAASPPSDRTSTDRLAPLTNRRSVRSTSPLATSSTISTRLTHQRNFSATDKLRTSPLLPNEDEAYSLQLAKQRSTTAASNSSSGSRDSYHQPRGMRETNPELRNRRFVLEEETSPAYSRHREDLLITRKDSPFREDIRTRYSNNRETTTAKRNPHLGQYQPFQEDDHDEEIADVLSTLGIEEEEEDHHGRNGMVEFQSFRERHKRFSMAASEPPPTPRSSMAIMNERSHSGFSSSTAAAAIARRTTATTEDAPTEKSLWIDTRASLPPSSSKHSRRLTWSSRERPRLTDALLSPPPTSSTHVPTNVNKYSSSVSLNRYPESDNAWRRLSGGAGGVERGAERGVDRGDWEASSQISSAQSESLHSYRQLEQAIIELSRTLTAEKSLLNLDLKDKVRDVAQSAIFIDRGLRSLQEGSSVQSLVEKDLESLAKESAELLRSFSEMITLLTDRSSLLPPLPATSAGISRGEEGRKVPSPFPSTRREEGQVEEREESERGQKSRFRRFIDRHEDLSERLNTRSNRGAEKTGGARQWP